jgi:hypothetical protein
MFRISERGKRSRLLRIFAVQWTLMLALTILSYIYVGDFIQGQS